MARTNMPEIIVRTKVNKGTVGFFGMIASLTGVLLKLRKRSNEHKEKSLTQKFLWFSTWVSCAWHKDIHHSLAFLESNWKNSSLETAPSWFSSAPLIMSSRSSSVRSSPSSWAILLKSFTVMKPVLSVSNRLKMWSIFSLESSSISLGVSRWMNCSKVMFPAPSESRSMITW